MMRWRQHIRNDGRGQKLFDQAKPAAGPGRTVLDDLAGGFPAARLSVWSLAQCRQQRLTEKTQRFPAHLRIQSGQQRMHEQPTVVSQRFLRQAQPLAHAQHPVETGFAQRCGLGDRLIGADGTGFGVPARIGVGLVQCVRGDARPGGGGIGEPRNTAAAEPEWRCSEGVTPRV